MVYAHDAVAWTEVPSTPEVLRSQRIRWHRGLMQVLWEYKTSLLNPRDGAVGMVGWPSYVIFEFLSPIIEALGWVIVPLAIAFDAVNRSVAVPLFLIAVAIGTLNTLMALMLDERFGHYRDHRMARVLLLDAVREQLGPRQRTVWWRIRAMFWRRSDRTWGDMQRTGVGNLAS